MCLLVLRWDHEHVPPTSSSSPAWLKSRRFSQGSQRLWGSLEFKKNFKNWVISWDGSQPLQGVKKKAVWTLPAKLTKTFLWLQLALCPTPATSSTWMCCPCSTWATTSRSVHLVEVRYTAVPVVTCQNFDLVKILGGDFKTASLWAHAKIENCALLSHT